MPEMGGVVEYHSRYSNHRCHSKYSSYAYERPEGTAIAICHRNRPNRRPIIADPIQVVPGSGSAVRIVLTITRLIVAVDSACHTNQVTCLLRYK